MQIFSSWRHLVKERGDFTSSSLSYGLIFLLVAVREPGLK